jgi:hypothetical protein
LRTDFSRRPPGGDGDVLAVHLHGLADALALEADRVGAGPAASNAFLVRLVSSKATFQSEESAAVEAGSP